MNVNKVLKGKSGKEIESDFCSQFRISEETYKKFKKAMRDTRNSYLPLIWELPLMIIAISIGSSFIYQLSHDPSSVVIFHEKVGLLKRTINIGFVIFTLTFIICGIIFPLIKMSKRHDW